MPRQPISTKRGKAALDALYRGLRGEGPPLLFLDFDGVLCLGRPYSWHDVMAEEQPPDLFERLWHAPAVQTLQTIVADYQPQVVITSSWTRFLDREALVELLCRTQMQDVSDALHPAWVAPQGVTVSRHDAIVRWLHTHYAAQPLLVLDDPFSGSGLFGSRLAQSGCVVLCDASVGLHDRPPKCP